MRRRAIILSVQPEWVALILDHIKRGEVRKVIPCLPLPFKVYVYCTKSGGFLYRSNNTGKLVLTKPEHRDAILRNRHIELSGKVVCEFVCDEIIEANISTDDNGERFIDNPIALEGTCLTERQVLEYRKNEGPIYTMKISDLKTYLPAKGLYEFYHKCTKMQCYGCEHLRHQKVNREEYDYDCQYIGGCIPIERAPQNFCYVEENDEKD